MSTGVPFLANCWPHVLGTKLSGFTTRVTSLSCPSHRCQDTATASTAAASAPVGSSSPRVRPMQPQWSGPRWRGRSRLSWSILVAARSGSVHSPPTPLTWFRVRLMALWLCGISPPKSSAGKLERWLCLELKLLVDQLKMHKLHQGFTYFYYCLLVPAL